MTWSEVPTDPVPTVYQRFVAAIRGQGAAEPDFARGAALQRMLDRAEESARAGCATLGMDGPPVSLAAHG